MQRRFKLFVERKPKYINSFDADEYDYVINDPEFPGSPSRIAIEKTHKVVLDITEDDKEYGDRYVTMTYDPKYLKETLKWMKSIAPSKFE